MTIQQRVIGDVTVLDLEGRMIVETESLDKMVSAAVRRLLGDGRNQILLNVQGVPSVDTTGLAEIIQGYLAATRRGGALKLEHPSPHVRELLRITGLCRVLEVFESESVAVASFHSSAS